LPVLPSELLTTHIAQHAAMCLEAVRLPQTPCGTHTHLCEATSPWWSNQYPCAFMPSSAAPPMVLLLALECRLLLLLLAPPWLVVLRGLSRCSADPDTAAAKAARALLLLPPPCRGLALRLRWCPGARGAGGGMLRPGLLPPSGSGLLGAGGWGVKPGPVPSRWMKLR
jgi:hypothetical protein